MVAAKGLQAFQDRSLVLKRLRDENLGFWGVRATLAHCLKCVEALRPSDLLEVFAACRKVGDWSLAWQCFHEIKTKFADARHVVLGNACMSTCSELSAWQNSLQVLSHMKWVQMETDLISCNTAIDAFSRHWQRATALLQNSLSKHLQCDSVSWNSLVRTYRSSRLWRLSLEVVCVLPGFGLKADRIMKTLNAACVDTLWQRATAVMMRDGDYLNTQETLDTLDTLACNALANCAARGQAWEKAMATLKPMQGLESLKPDIISFNTVLNAFERSVRWPFALEILGEVVLLHLQPNSVTLGTASCACASSTAWELSLRDVSTHNGGANNTFLAFSYSAAASAFASIIKWAEALNLFRMARSKALSEQLFSATMLACGLACPDRWAQTFHLMSFWEQGDLQISSESLNAVFQVCYTSYQWRYPLHLLLKMHRLRIPLDSSGLSCLIRICGHAGAWEAGTTLLPYSTDSLDPVWSSNCWTCESSASPAPVLPALPTLAPQSRKWRPWSLTWKRGANLWASWTSCASHVFDGSDALWYVESGPRGCALTLDRMRD